MIGSQAEIAIQLGAGDVVDAVLDGCLGMRMLWEDASETCEKDYNNKV